MKICVVCSHGGHLTETLELIEAFKGYDIFFVTYASNRNAEIESIAPAYFMSNIGKSIPRMIAGLFYAAKILMKEKPSVLFSMGAEVAIPFFYLGKLLGMKTIFIEGLFRVEDLSMTGRIVYPIADVFLVQWPQLLQNCGSKARFEGSII